MDILRHDSHGLNAVESTPYSDRKPDVQLGLDGRPLLRGGLLRVSSPAEHGSVEPSST